MAPAAMREAMSVSYQPSLVALSIGIAILASYVALNLAYSVTEARGRTRAVWLSCGALAMGFGIWSMHFVGMLAFEMPGMEMGYDFPLMLLSVLVAVLGSALALYIIRRDVVTAKAIGLGGCAMAIAISGMHYIGMHSMRMGAYIVWNYGLVTLSVAIALAASVAALILLVRFRKQDNRALPLILASVVMGIAIAGMHYTGMIAATFIHDASAHISDQNVLVTSGLTAAVIAATILILGCALLGSVGQRVLHIREKRSQERLGQSEERYRLLVRAVKEYAIFMVCAESRITTWNSGAEHIFGLSERAVVGRPVADFQEQLPVIAELLREDGALITHLEREVICRRGDGTRFWASVIVDALGEGGGFSLVIRDITRFKQAAERARYLNEELEARVRARTLELAEREGQLRTITDAIPMLVAQFDASERLLFANEAFRRWFAADLDPARDGFCSQLLGERVLARAQLVRVLSGETITFEARPREEGGAVLNFTLIPEFSPERTVRKFLLVAADVSNYKRIEAELKIARDNAEVASRAKSAFLANMSHEIRTPLGAVLGFSELILNGELAPEERQQTIGIIKRNGQLLSTLINDILDLSKVEAGKLTTEMMDVVLLDVLGETATLLDMEASSKKLKFTVATEGALPNVIRTDPIRLRQILFNIVGNAIKFTAAGRVSLTARLARENAGLIEFVVEDTGAGISPEQRTKLFAPFQQADVTTTREFGGTGLGLVLARKLAQALGGDVVLAKSALGEGSTFVITIEHGQNGVVLLKDSHLKDVSAPMAPVSEDVSLKRVLVVDDNEDNLLLVQSMLRFAGATVEVAHNGSDGVEKALRGDYHLVLMDLQMPGMDGFEAMRELRRRGFQRPIIALTAHAMKEERERCLQSGFTEHLVKPIDRRSLLHTVAEFGA